MSERVAALRAAAPWLTAPELGACIVGSAALAEACRRAGLAGPRVADVDLAWAPDVDAGEALLRQHGVYVATTSANRSRGTLAMKLGANRYEITSLRGAAPGGASLVERIELDLSLRDMTVGALAWRLGDEAILDPLHGLAHWRERRIVACGDPLARVREHPVRLLRYYRRAHEWGFALDAAIRRVEVDATTLATIPPRRRAASSAPGCCAASRPAGSCTNCTSRARSPRSRPSSRRSSTPCPPAPCAITPRSVRRCT